MSEDVALRNNIVCHAWTETDSDKGEHIEAALKEVYGGAKTEAQRTRGAPVWSPAITALLYSICVCLEHAVIYSTWLTGPLFESLVKQAHASAAQFTCERSNECLLHKGRFL